MGDIVDDVVDWLKSLIMGDWDEDAPTSTVVINGLLGLIPVIDQLLDVRDVAGILFRINRGGGFAKATREDKMNLALAALGCIPEFGSAMKTALKVLWKERKVGGKLVRSGMELVERMRGMQKGAAITWVKTLQWGQLASDAAIKVDLALTQMILLLGWLSAEDRWWVPDSLEGLARDVLPEIQKMKGTFTSALNEGIYAVRDFVNELIGEDAAVLVVAMAQQTPSHHSANHHQADKRTKRNQPTSTEGKRPANHNPNHKPIDNKNTQTTDKGNPNRPAMTQAAIKALFEDVGKRFKALLGEHMGDYHHMAKVAPGGWPHGVVAESKLKPAWSSTAKLVDEKNPRQESTPTELVQEHLIRTSQQGVDGVWSLGDGVYHFVEAKCSESVGAMYGLGYKQTNDLTYKDGSTHKASKLAPPPGLTERQLALWYLLGQPNKGLQMGKRWLEKSAHSTMLGPKNLKNRFVYLFFILPGVSKPPKEYTTLKPGGALNKDMAGGMGEHGQALTLAATALEGLHDPAVYDHHKPTHERSDMFSFEEIDVLDEQFNTMIDKRKTNKQPSKEEKTPPAERSPKSGKAAKRTRSK